MSEPNAVTTATAGGWRVTPLLDGVMRLRGSVIYPDATAEQWKRHAGLLDVDALLELPLGAFLLTRGDRIVLVDTGGGPEFTVPDAFGRLMEAGGLPSALARLGVAPADVTDVILSHLHTDHIGWVSRGGRPFFPRATYHCHLADWDHFVGGDPVPDPRLPPLLTPVEDRLRPWTDSGSLFPGLELWHTPGHTPGSSVVVVSGTRGRVGMVGDLLHCPVELADPDMVWFGDVDHARAREVRRDTASRFEREHILMSGPHFPGPDFGAVVKDGADALRWEREPRQGKRT